MGQLCNLSTMECCHVNAYTYMRSPLGQITLQTSNEGLLGVWFETQTTQPTLLGDEQPQHPILVETEHQLRAYFEKRLLHFDVPLAAKGTEFQTDVWRVLTTIPYGKTWTYQELANAIGNPKAVRAVGLANGKNPISIIVPCHRVVGKSGKLTGYAGGVERKKWLLDFESNSH